MRLWQLRLKYTVTISRFLESELPELDVLERSRSTFPRFDESYVGVVLLDSVELGIGVLIAFKDFDLY